MHKLSEYELEREANIARNRALLEELELKQAVSDIGLPRHKPQAPKLKAKAVHPTKRVKKEKTEPELPRRQSSRLKRSAPSPLNETPEERRKREAEEEERRAKETEERLEAEARERLAKRPRHHDLELSTVAEHEDTKELVNLSTALQNFAQTPQPKAIGDPEEFAYKEDQRHNTEVAELRKRLGKMVIVSRAKVTQDRVYSAAYHPEKNKDLIFFGDKHGQLGIWDARAPPEEIADEDGDVTSTDTEGGKYWRLQLHWPATAKSSISCVKFDPIDAHNVYTSSYDCTLRSLSFASGVSREIFSTEEGVLPCSFDVAPHGHEMWISDGQGGITHLDLRQDKSKAQWYGVAEQKIGCVSINPSRPHFLLTASNDRSLKIWDSRKLKGILTELPNESPSKRHQTEHPIHMDSVALAKYLETKKGHGCLRAEWRHNKSVSSAYWDSRGRAIVSTSYDNTLRLWDIPPSRFDSDEPFPSSRPFMSFSHNCQTGKWLTVLRAQWTPNVDVYPHFTIGNMNHALDIYSWKGDLVARLSDAQRISAVQAVTCSHPNIIERAASGNASGRCFLWAPSGTL